MPAKRKRLVFALCAAPLVIASPLILEGLRDSAMIATRWDSWLLFVFLPFAAAGLIASRRG